MKTLLLIFARCESPAWDIPLEPGQYYAGMDEREHGVQLLRISLANRSTLTPAQEHYLTGNPHVVRYDLKPVTTASLSPVRGINGSLHGFPTWREVNR